MKKRYPRRKNVFKKTPYFISQSRMSENVVVAVNRQIYSLLLDLFKSAERSIKIASFQVNISNIKKWGIPYSLYSYIWNVRERNVDVKVLLNKRFSNIRQLMLNQETKKVLEKVGVNVKFIGGRNTLHNKLIIVDDVRAYIGSSNLTTTSLMDNWEIGVKIEGDLVKSVVVPEFKRLWEIE